jgi:hypothetical protein
MKRRPPVGIRSDRFGLRAYLKVVPFQREKRFPKYTVLRDIQAWAGGGPSWAN